MTTFGGDLLRILAHGGVNTLSNMGSQLLTNYLKPGLDAKTELVKEYINTLRTGSTEEQEAVAPILEKQTGWELPRVAAMNPAGREVSSPEGRELTLPTSTPLSELAEGYKPQTRLVRPPAEKLEQLAAGLTTRALTGAPGDVSLGASLLDTVSKEKKLTDMQTYVDAVKRGDTTTVAAIEKFYGGRNALRAMYNEYQRNPEAVGGFFQAKSPSDLTRTQGMSVGEAAGVGQKRTLMEPEVSVLNPSGTVAGTAPRGSIKLEEPTKKAPSVAEQMQEIDKEINILTRSISEGVYKRPDAKEEVQGRIRELKTQKESLGKQSNQTQGGLSPAIIGAFQKAYQTNPELAISNAKKKGFYDKLKASGVIK